ncbi:ead/Ea22-like family protein [Klebsiella pneumoniae]|uniref:ead/Ea22-like family protein n=1 Tax=Klebsiella pneumoniae TaxID=573 RepID=UPI0035C95F58
MTDITELAQSLKAAADREMICRDVAETSEIWERTVTPENILALVEALEYYKSREERVTSLVRDNSKSWDELYRQVEAKGKRNVELVEALASEKRICATWRKTAEANSEKLEKAQQQMTESENRVRKQNRHICELFDDNTALCQRIAELESRTVKLPKLKMLEDYLAEVAIEERKQILVGVKLEFHRALTDAGIKVEAE